MNLKKHNALAIALATFLALAAFKIAGCQPPDSGPQPTPSRATRTPLDEPSAPPTSPGGCCGPTWGSAAKASRGAVRLTSYYPHASQLEGGFKNRYGGPLMTLQAFMAGKAPHVSVAIDQDLGRIKRKFCSEKLSAAYGKPLRLFVEDTGGAFRGKGFSRADICTENYKASVDPRVNGVVDMTECE